MTGTATIASAERLASIRRKVRAFEARARLAGKAPAVFLAELVREARGRPGANR